MKTNPVINFLVFTCFLVIGYTFSLRFYQPASLKHSNPHAMVTSESLPSIASLETGQRSILLVGASSLDRPHPVLEAVWLATYLPGGSDVQLLPIYPSTGSRTSDLGQNLAGSFSLVSQHGSPAPNPVFFSLLAENNYWWSGYIVFDVALIPDHQNPITSGQTQAEVQVSGMNAQALAHIQNSGSQAIVIQAMCRSLSSVGIKTGLDELARRVGDQILTDLDFAQLGEDLASLSAAGQSLTCRFPTLEVSRILP